MAITSSTTETHYQCGECKTGVVKMICKQGPRSNTISVKRCNNKKCAYEYGLFRIHKLQLVKP